MIFSIDTGPQLPDLTLAHHAKGSVPPTRSAPVVWPVRSFELVVSTGNAGARYGELRMYSRS
jgi:hypothetical protein